MGGNVKYRSRYVYYTDANGTKQVMRDSSGNPVKTGYPQYTDDGTRKLKSLNATRRANGATNARERMLNAQAVKQVRDLAKEYRTVTKNITDQLLGNAPIDFDTYNKNVDRRNDINKTLANLANQVQSGTVPNVNAITPNDRKNIESILGIKLS